MAAIDLVTRLIETELVSRERLKPDNSINPSRMLQRRALVTARGAVRQ